MKFLQQLAEYTLEKHGEHLDDLIVIFPNNRAKLFYNQFLSNSIRKTSWLPNSYGSIEFFEKLSQLSLADDYILSTHLYSSLPEEIRQEQSFDAFLSWATQVLQDFKEIDHELVNAESLYSSLNEIKQLEQWDLNLEHRTAEQEKFLGFFAQLGEIYIDFTEKLISESLAHAGLLERKALDRLPEFLSNFGGHILIAGFNALTKAELEIFQGIVKNGKGQIFFDYDSFYTDDEIHEGGLFARKNIQSFRQNPLTWTNQNIEANEHEVQILKCSNSMEQIHVLSELIRNDKVPATEETAVILADESLLIPLLSSIPEEIRDINVTMGYSLRFSPYYGFFEALNRLIFGLESNRKLYYKDVFRLCRNETFLFLIGNEKAESIQSFLHKLIAQNRSFIEIKEFMELIPKEMISRSWAVHTNIGASHLLDLIDLSIRILDEKISAEDSLQNKIRREFLLHHLDIKNQIQKVIESLKEEVSYLTFLKIWKHYHKINKVQFTGEPLNGLQVMGLLETRNLDFKNVYILGMNEGQIPSGRQYGSLIPFDLRKHFGLLVYKDKEAVFAYHFYRLMQRSKRIRLLFHTKSGDMGGGEPSRFITQIQQELAPMEKWNVSQFDVKPAMRHPTKDRIPILSNNAVLDKILNRYDKGISPSALTTFLNCPLDFYYKYIIGLWEEDDVSEETEARDFGNIIHEVLKDLYLDLKGETLNIDMIQAMRAKVDGLLTKHYVSVFGKNFKDSGRNTIAYDAAKKYISQFLKMDARRIKNHRIKLLGVEQEIELNETIDFEGRQIPFKLSGTIDRIELIDGQLSIIDYKTGLVEDRDLKCDSIDQAFEQNKKFIVQLSLYALMANRSSGFGNGEIKCSVYSMRRFNEGFIPVLLNKKETLLQDHFNEILNEVKSLASTIAFHTESFEHNEKSNYCEMC